MTASDDEKWMRHALALAARGVGWTSPNPMVGAVVARGKELLAEGFHERCGEAHGERIALDRAGEAARGATLFVTLEPCAHQGRTPPCLDRVLESGVARVVVAMKDPNPLTDGRSLAAMRERGIEVEVGVLEREARLLNHPFLSRVLRKRPWVTLKYAMTLDGRIAASTGSSKWISGVEAREWVHDLRRSRRAIVVGYRTAITDDPILTCRIKTEPPPRQPLRIVLGGTGSLPRGGKLAATARDAPVLHVISARRYRGKLEEPPGVEGVLLGENLKPGESILHELLALLHEREVDSLLVEGGAQTLAGFLDAGLVDEVHAVIGPKILNDAEAISPFPGNNQCSSIADGVELQSVDILTMGADVIVHGYLNLL